MLPRILARVALAALLAAAVDAFATRLGLPHRPATPRLFLELAAAWCLPAALAALGRRALGAMARAARPAPESDPWPTADRILALCIAPVVLHTVLDRHTSIGGDLSGLRSFAPWLNALAALLAAAALVLLAGAWLRRRQARTRGLLVVGLLACGALLPRTGIRPPERTTAADTSSPNLLLLVWDTARHGSFSFLGAERPTTPELEVFAQQALVFENARSVTHFTFTSHLSMLTGRYPTEHGARLLDTRHVPERGIETIAAELRRQGYRTGGFVGTGVLRASTGIADGFDVYSDQVDPALTESHLWALVHDLQSVLIRRGGPGWNDGRPHWIQDFQRPSAEVLAEAAAWIEEGGDQPWFCFVNLFDVHWPYTPSEPARARFAGDYSGVVDGFSNRASDFPDDYQLTPADDAHLAALYEAEFSDLDRRVGAFLETLALETSNTAVLITADHGEAFGEGGRYEHEDIIEPQVRVPMVLRLPGATPRHGRFDAPVSGIDVAVTLRSLAGLPPRPDQVLGLDLSSPDLPGDRVVFVEDRDHHDPERAQFAAYRGRFKLVWLDALRDERFELYDLESDPNGLVDVSAQHPEVFEDLRTLLLTTRSWLPLDAIETGDGTIDTDALRALGYLGD
jgi:arylsulfatase A-like enzyme